jgi:hypothetical protein
MDVELSLAGEESPGYKFSYQCLGLGEAVSEVPLACSSGAVCFAMQRGSLQAQIG